MSQHARMRNEQENAPELAYNIDQLEALVSNAKRFPLGQKPMIDEQEFIFLLDEIRATIPVEIRDAQRLLKERERIIGEAQEEAARIVADAQEHARALVADHPIMTEAKKHAEKLLMESERERNAMRGETEVYLLQQVDAIYNVFVGIMGNIEGPVLRSLQSLEDLKSALEGEARNQK